MDFTGKYAPWALVAGASEGLGAAFADECASRGLNVVLIARRLELLEQTASGIRDRHGVDALAYVVGATATPHFMAGQVEQLRTSS